MFLSSFLNEQTFQIVLWLVVFIVALLIELATTDLVSIWFCGGSLVALIMSFFKIDFVWEFVVFAVVTAVLLVISKLFLRKKLHTDDTATNADSLIGKEIQIISNVDSKTPGQGIVRDVVWTVVSENDNFEKGEYAIVKRIVGNKLIIKKKEV